MKINEIIKERRLAKNLTQEQLAVYLGITAPAVNKWEKGASYPDITILPALARVLETDLNTLLSFQDDLTEKEIGLFLNHLSETANTDGFENAYALAMEKLKEYPTCYPLVLHTALFLDGTLMFNKNNKTYPENYQVVIESFYERALCSPDQGIRARAQSILISKYMGRKEYDKAQELLETLPEESPADKKQLQANLHIARGNLEAAAKLEEEKLLSAATEIYMVLMILFLCCPFPAPYRLQGSHEMS